MITIEPGIRSAGAGPSVILLHSSGSSSKQWDRLVDLLQPRFRVHAVDFHGHGATPPWHSDRPLTLADEAALVEPLIDSAQAGVHLVGHSYGGAVALKLALTHPARVRSLTVYEPVVFRMLFDFSLSHAASQSVLTTAASMRACLARGEREEAARQFVDFWSGAGAWDAMPPARQQAVAARMPAVMLHFDALFFDSMRLSHLATLTMPGLVLTGARTIPATRCIGELLRHALPCSRHNTLPDAGHLGPITHATAVNARIARFLEARPLLSRTSEQSAVAA